MKNLLFFMFFFLIVSLTSSLIFAGGQKQSTDTVDLQRLVTPPVGWHMTETPQTARGEELFTIINGGAEMYLQLGFHRSIFASYQDEKGIVVNLEVYEMQNPEAAREVYLKKIGSSGKAVKLGTESMQEEYYLNFWKGPFQVTISGYDATRETMDAIMAIADMVDHRL
jgi:hypothetical protein